MHLSGHVSGHLSFVCFLKKNISQGHNFRVLSLFAINVFFSPVITSFVLHSSSFLICLILFFPSLMVQRYCFYPCQTVLSLTCFIVSTKEMGTNYVCLQQAARIRETRHWF